MAVSGFGSEKPLIGARCTQKNSPLILKANFSVGANLTELVLNQRVWLES